MAYPRFQLARNFKTVTYTAGSLSLTATTSTAVHASALDITLSAQAGDVIEYNISGRTDIQTQFIAFDVYTIVSSSPVNPFGAGLSASLATAGGVAGWFVDDHGNSIPVTGAAVRTMTSGDLSSGTVTLRLYYVKATATARTLYATANDPLTVWAKNLGPVDPN